MKSTSPKHIVLYVIVFIVAVFAFCAILSSCKIIKAVNKLKSDTTAVSKSDTGNVKTSTGRSKTEDQWWKETMDFGFDTTINNYITKPVRIIREGGKSSQQSEFKNVDSSWKQAFDSLSAKVSSSEKQSKTTVLSMGQIIAIALGAAIIVWILSFVFSKFKIIRV